MGINTRFGSEFQIYTHQIKKPELKGDLVQQVVERLNAPRPGSPNGFNAVVDSDSQTGQAKTYQNEYGDSVVIIKTPTATDDVEGIKAERAALESLRREMSGNGYRSNGFAAQALGRKINFEMRESEQFPDRTYLLANEGLVAFPELHWVPLYSATGLFDQAHLTEEN